MIVHTMKAFVINLLMRLDPGMTRSEAVKKLLENHYMKNFNNKISNVRGILDMTAHSMFVAPTLGTADRVSEVGNKVGS